MPSKAHLLTALAALACAASSTWSSPVTLGTGQSPVGTTSAARSPPVSYRIEKRTPQRSGDELISWATGHRNRIQTKYGLGSKAKRAAEDIERRTAAAAILTNYQYDSTWFTSFDVGTPATAYNLILDTGSSDIWLAATNYTASSSSSFSNTSTNFDIEYGSGSVSGYMAKETFVVAGHTIAQQPFAVATTVSSELADSTTSGICGLGFQALSVAGSEPIWQAAGESEFSFYLETATTTASTSSGSGGGSGGGGGGSGGGSPGIPFRKRASSTSAGGVFTLGGTNTSLYQGDINWVDVISKTYWLVTLGGITSQGSAISIGNTYKAAIDTGTTLIGGPTSVIADFYSQISGASAMSSASGYYQFPCSSSVNATITFGDQQYTLSSDSFNVGTVDSSGQYCMGAFFAVDTDSSSTLQWIVGDVFLSSVYSIFKNGDTAQVGFAALADGLNEGSSTSTTVSSTQTRSGAWAVSIAARSSVATGLIASTILAAVFALA